MKPALSRLLDEASPFLPWLLAALAVGITGALAHHAFQTRIAALAQEVTQLEENLARYESFRGELNQLGRGAAPAGGHDTQDSVLVILEQTATQAGLRGQVVSLSAREPGGAIVVVQDMEFAAWLRWVEQLHSTRGLQILSASLESTLPGRVNGQAIFETTSAMEGRALPGNADLSER